MRAHCMRTAHAEAGILENNEIAFNLVLHCPDEQPTQTCKVQLCRGMQDAHMFKWQVPHSDISPGRWPHNWQQTPSSFSSSSMVASCKEVLHPCMIEAMDIVILLLVFTQSFPTNIRYSGVQAALIGAVMHTYFKIEKLPMCSRRTTLIPNHNICGGSQQNVTYPYYIPKIVHSHCYLINMACVLGIEKDIRQIPTHRAYGHAVGKMCYEIREVGMTVVRRKPLLPPYLIHHGIQQGSDTRNISHVHAIRTIGTRLISTVVSIGALSEKVEVLEQIFAGQQKPLPTQGPHSGEKSIWLHHPCLLGVPMVGRNQYAG